MERMVRKELNIRRRPGTTIFFFPTEIESDRASQQHDQARRKQERSGKERRHRKLPQWVRDTAERGSGASRSRRQKALQVKKYMHFSTREYR